MTVRTLGRLYPGDGGGNDYEIVPGGTGVEDDGTFITLNRGLQAKGLFPDGAMMRQFGVVGDGKADDTIAIQRAINSGQTSLTFNENLVCSVNSLRLRSNLHLRGSGSTLIQRSPGQTIFVAKHVDNLIIEGFEMNGNGLGIFGAGQGHGFAEGDKAFLGIQTSNVAILNNHIHDFTNNGIVFMTPSDDASDQVDIRIERNSIRNIGKRLSGVDTPNYHIQHGEGIAIAIGDNGNRSRPKNKNIRIFGNNISNTYQTQISAGECDGLIITENILSDGDANGIQVGTGSTNVMISLNKIAHYTARVNPKVEGRGISVHADGDEGYFIITSNEVIEAGLIGIDVRTPYMTVTDNVVISAGANNQISTSCAGIQVLTANVGIEGNTVISPKHRGIDVIVNQTSKANISIHNNTVVASGRQGIHFRRNGGKGRFSQISIHANKVIDSHYDGIYLGWIDNLQVSNNIVSDYNVAHKDKSGIYIFESSNAVISHNIVKTVHTGGHDVGSAITTRDIQFTQDNIFETENLANDLGNSITFDRNGQLPPGYAFRGVIVKATNRLTKIYLPLAKQGMSFTAYGENGGAAQLVPQSSDNFLGKPAGLSAKISACNAANIVCLSTGIWCISPVDGSRVEYQERS